MNRTPSLIALFLGFLLLSGFGGRNPSGPRQFTASDRGNISTTRTALSGKCQQVKVDCRTHRIFIQGAQLSQRDSVIDCGKNGTTINGSGTIGGLHRGKIVKDGVRVEGISGMGDSGGGKVFHTPWWNPGQMPKGVNGSKGCVRTSPKVLQVLKSCKGAPLTITGATDRSRRGGASLFKPPARR